MTSPIEFVDELPPDATPGRKPTLEPIRSQLRNDPGQWAIVHRRTLPDDLAKAKKVHRLVGQFAWRLHKGAPDITAAVRTVGVEVRVYARADEGVA